MITPEDMKVIAREKEIDPIVIERDYVQNWFLKSLYSNTEDLIFKGGTSIRKAFIQDYRFSDDLDFTLTRVFDTDELNELINKTKAFVRDEIGVLFEDDTLFKDVESGWKVVLKYNSKISGQTINLILDITKVDLEIILTPVEEHHIIHNYPDNCEVKLRTYSILEITAEKLRALFQRGYPRDLYDVTHLWPLVNKENIKPILYEKCKFKGFDPSLVDYDNNEERLKSAWTETLIHQFKTVPDFDEAFQRGLLILDELGIKK